MNTYNDGTIPKVGDVVKLIDGTGMSAMKGATAKVYKTGRYLSIKWIKNDFKRGQIDGGYYHNIFIPIKESLRSLLE